MERRVPSDEDWENYRANRDISYAYEKFAGKTNSEMQEEFKGNVIERTEDIRWMPQIPFQYYILGFKQYIDTEDFGQFEKPDAASCFIGLIRDKIKSKPHFVKPILHELMSTLNYIAKNQDYFEADIDIYGDFNEKLELIKTYCPL